MTIDDPTETEIAAYRAQLRAQAELADGDLDEIEDHLRTLTHELRARGMPAATAVTEAARRLGQPRDLAREHSRVRSAFGSRLSPARTWSVVVLLVPMLVYAAITTIPYVGIVSRFTFEYVAGIILAGALVLRMGWARPILLGGIAFFVIPTLHGLMLAPDASPLFLIAHLGLIGFLMPWRRNELTRSGLALVLYVWSYGAASYALLFRVTIEDGSPMYVAPMALVACGAAALATVGAVLRARWSSAAGIVATGTLVLTVTRIAPLDFRFEHPMALQLMLDGGIVTGAVAALAGSVLAWRTARSRFGSLRAIRS